jgi:hypothetical protein
MARKLPSISTLKFLNASELIVNKVTRATDVLSADLTLDVDYTVEISETTEGGTVTFAVAPLATEDSFIRRSIPLTQGADVPTNNIFREVQIENALDRIVMMAQELQEQMDRVAVSNPTSTVDLIFPAPAADNIIAWNAAGDALENKTGLDAAITACQAAQTAAETAQTNAETAETNAETAETNAETAQTAAEAAQTAAEAAQTAAEAAQAAIEGGVNTYEEEFTDGDLSSGELTVTHSLGDSHVLVQVYDNNNKLVLPDDITLTSTNVVTVDLTSFGTISGTWKVFVVGSTLNLKSADVSALEDADQDTGIDVEETADKDEIKMQVGGSEAGRIHDQGVVDFPLQSRPGLI